ncbi:hypothetical protein [Gluconobacter roseus]|uniref:Uncharacterized protein n=1 Tax=Gluconobacter roseus NBRC 3990 TaxID=1307950 RepID=A0A4Y3M5F1_9PROT|nr:hypothetical protein [Gluconobacter roseus]GBR47652.1 hypothetical protein AA3990_1852 [Gluconobacter roseus NBRC 3990]GEB04480.1 hypothetical protein GRO01_20560 [Gluconobacter roseus NBRC 3990]GLP92382.1 hypothetical protein GCM10007871_03600 [Gluconobacter roseus NBRC 3990]
MASTYWTGGTNGDFYNVKNWSTGASPTTYHDVNITGTSSTATAEAVAGTANSTAVPSLTIGDYGTLDITASSCTSSESSPVFSTSSFQVFQYGSIVIDTGSAVQLGDINVMDGTMTIENNRSNVFMGDGERLNGSGTLNLVNSTFGSQTDGVNIANSMHITLSGDSSVYTGFLATGVSVSFDPKSSEQFFLNGQDTTVDTSFSNVSGKTEFGITANTGETPLSASYVKNTDGSYSLVVQESDNHTLTLSNVSMASGYTPGTLQITQDKSGNYLISDASADKGSSDNSHCGHWDHNSHSGCEGHSGKDGHSGWNGHNGSSTHNDNGSSTACGSHSGSWGWGSGGCSGSDLASSIHKIISAMNGAFSSCSGWQSSGSGSSNCFGGSFGKSGNAWGCSTASTSHAGSQGCFSSTTQSASHSQVPVLHNTSHWGC